MLIDYGYLDLVNKSTLQTVMKNKKMNMNSLFKNLGRADITYLVNFSLLKEFFLKKKLKVKKIDLLALHGINTDEHLHHAIKDGGCIDILRNLQKENLIGSIGFSTHGKSSLIEKAISTNFFDYVNLHWYFINQENTKVINLANKYDLGVFIISPTDKGGHLHTPSNKMLELCKPLHPIVFNDLF